MDNKTHLWLIRAYAAIILVVLFGGFLEGGAYKLVMALAAGAIIGWSFLLRE